MTPQNPVLEPLSPRRIEDRADREPMYARWRQIRADWQKTQAEEAAHPRPRTKLIEVPVEWSWICRLLRVSRRKEAAP